MNIAPIASYVAEPSMLMIEPIGSMNRLTRLSTPILSSTQRKVTGRVAELKMEGNIIIIMFRV